MQSNQITLRNEEAPITASANRNPSLLTGKNDDASPNDSMNHSNHSISGSHHSLGVSQAGDTNGSAGGGDRPTTAMLDVCIHNLS